MPKYKDSDDVDDMSKFSDVLCVLSLGKTYSLYQSRHGYTSQIARTCSQF